MTALPAIVCLVLLAEAGSIPDDSSHALCGAYCLYVALGALDVESGTFEEFHKRLGESEGRGYSLGELADFAERAGLNTLGVKTSTSNLKRRPGQFVCIAQIRGNHFAILSDVQGKSVTLVDPPKESQVPIDTLGTTWDGTALLLARAPLLAEEALPRPWPRWIWGVTVTVLILIASGWHLSRRRLLVSTR